MRLFPKRIVKRCSQGHEMAMEWRSCPRCTGHASATTARDELEATVVFDPAAPPVPRAAARPSIEAPLARLVAPEASLELFAGRTKIGKSPRAETGARTLSIPDEAVSRDHFAITAGAGGLVLVDLASTNGTFVNGQRVERAMLEDGDEVRVGRTRFRVSRAST